MTVNNSYLVGLFSSSSSSSTNLFSALYPASTSTSSTTASASSAKTYTPPTPPWSSSSKSSSGSTSQSALIQAALNGQPIINASAAKLSVSSSNSSLNQDYKNLFALYQGLNTLHGLTQEAGSAGNTSGQTAQIKQAFSSGMIEVASFLQGANFKNVTVVQGSVATQETTKVSTPVGSSNYVGQNIVSGSSADAAAAFDGPVQFSMNLTDTSGAKTTVSFDLSEMGSETRSLTNVVNYLNSKLETAGVETRFSTQRTAGQTQTTKVGSQTVTLSATPDQYALVVDGSPTESVSFSAPATADAVYVAQGSGAQASAGQQLLKFQTDATQGATPPAAQAQPQDTHVTSGEAWQDNLPSTVTGVQATAAGPDGSVYVLADVNGTTSGQPIQGKSDVALMKYDSAGNLVFTQTLGAAQSASGYGLAVSADGEVAVTGSVTGSLNPGDGLANTATSAFVSVYDGSGNQLWSQTLAADSGSQANAVTFGAGDSVYVAGQTNSAIAGAGGEIGASDSFLAGYSSSGRQSFVTQFGTSGYDRATAVTVDGSQVLVGGVENGSAVVRSYQVGGSGQPTLSAEKNLGFLNGGSVAGIAVNNGQLIVAGTTNNTGLNAGTTTAAGGSGSNAFVAALDPSLQPSASDSIAYYQDQGATTVSAVSVADGNVFIAGQTGPTISVPNPSTSSSSTTTSQAVTGRAGYIAQIDPASGQVGFSTALSGQSGIAAPTSISVSTGAASVLDRLGLPSGTIAQTAASDLLTTNTSVRAGDSFYIQGIAGQSPVKITVQADDTWKTLASRIEQASDFRLTATVNGTSSNQTLSLKAAYSDASVQILDGPAGQDALKSLGLTSGLVQPNPSSSSSSSSTKTNTTFGLSLPSSLDLNNAADVKYAAGQLQLAIAEVQSAYQALVTANTPKTAASASKSGTVPAYLKAQLANYSAGLARLGGS